MKAAYIKGSLFKNSNFASSDFSNTNVKEVCCFENMTYGQIKCDNLQIDLHIYENIALANFLAAALIHNGKQAKEEMLLFDKNQDMKILIGREYFLCQ